MINTYIFVVDQEEHLIYCEASNYDIANKLCEYALNTSVMRVRTTSTFNKNIDQILLQQNVGMVRPGEGSVAKPSDIDEFYQVEKVDLPVSHKTIRFKKTKKILNIKKECLILIDDMAEKFMSRYTDRYILYNDKMIECFASQAGLSFELAKKFIDMENDSYFYGKAKIDGSVYKLIQKVNDINSQQELPKLKRLIDNMVYVN